MNDEINFNIISSGDDPQDAITVIRAFRILRAQRFFQAIETKNYIIWTDCGKHFRNCLVMGYFLKELKNAQIHGKKENINFYLNFRYIYSVYLILVNFNFFGEKHGKSGRDTHFSCISKFIRDESLVRQLTCSKDIVNAIHIGQKRSNKNRVKNSMYISLKNFVFNLFNISD